MSDVHKEVVGRGWIGVDLDGTLAEYHGWQGMGHIGAPVPAMVERVKAWLAEGKDVRIFTARICPQQNPGDIDTALRAITHWTFTHIGQQLPITCEKDWAMLELWDDRCIQIFPNTGDQVSIRCERELTAQAADYENRLCEERKYTRQAVDRISDLESQLAAALERVKEQEHIIAEFADWGSEECPKPCPFRENRIAAEIKEGDADTREEAERIVDADSLRPCRLGHLEGTCWIEHYCQQYRSASTAQLDAPELCCESNSNGIPEKQ